MPYALHMEALEALAGALPRQGVQFVLSPIPSLMLGVSLHSMSGNTISASASGLPEVRVSVLCRTKHHVDGGSQSWQERDEVRIALVK